MQSGRRNNDRRRRVLYSAHQADHEPASAASRRAAEKLREARCPQMAYGSRVHRRIRGRWFSLVPIRLRSMLLVTISLTLLAALLCVAHYLSVAWTPLSSRPQIARPLRLDRPDSFGRWFIVAMLTVTAGISLMTYQLRRYRNDDFGGHYRLWRVVILVSALASVNALVSLVDWGGAIVDAGFGKRVALAGSDWVRLLVTLGGAVLALRMVAELWHCRTALILMLTGCILFVIPEAVQWNILKIDSAVYWTVATTAPLLGCTTLLIGMLTYLRMLYREVKQVEVVSVMDRLRQFKGNLFRQEEDLDGGSSSRETDSPVPKSEKRRWWQSKSKSKLEPQPPTPSTATSRPKPVSRRKPEKTSTASQTAAKDHVETVESSKNGETKRRWLGFRKPKSPATKTKSPADDKHHAQESLVTTSATKSKKRDKHAGKTPGESGVTESQPERKSFMKWRRKKSPDSTPPIEQTESTQATPPKHVSKPVNQTTDKQIQNQSSEEELDNDTIDWKSMSKAQRRRLRKQMKRQNRAA